MSFLPIDKKDMKDRGWEQVDFVLVTGDAYVDHPSFGTAIISRVLENYGYKVGILSQPEYRDAKDFKRFGKPRLGFLINSGNVDSMVNHFSVSKKRRKNDKYSPGGKAGKRPDRAVIVYSNRAREAYKDVPIIIGGLEASLRRFAHYDYWEDKVRRSILLDSKADLLIYGMGEKAIIEIAQAIDSGLSIKDITWISGTSVKLKEIPATDHILLPSFEEIVNDKKKYCESFMEQYRNNDSENSISLLEPYGESTYIMQNIPNAPLEGRDLDDVYDLNYERTYHPIYEKEGGVPAIEEVEFSIVSSRGCFGGCAFCALTYHQGRQVRGRSKESILREGKLLREIPSFKGYIHDVGGPTANFRNPSCEKQREKGVCTFKDCLYPNPCKEMKVDHSEYLDILRDLRELEGIKKVFIRSGVRYDYALADKNDRFIKELCEHHISGTLKVAPEHVSSKVLKLMRKPNKEVFEEFRRKYEEINQKLDLNQYMIPYFISSHPGSTMEDAIELALYLKKMGFVPDQVQDFYPTPGTLATCMYYTEIDPFTKERIYVAKTMKEKNAQRTLLHFNKRENRGKVIGILKEANREDLIPILLGREGKR